MIEDYINDFQTCIQIYNSINIACSIKLINLKLSNIRYKFISTHFAEDLEDSFEVKNFLSDINKRMQNFKS